MRWGNGTLAGVVGVTIALAGCGSRGDEPSAGYALTPPPGWSDITREVEQRSDVRLDVAYGGRVERGVRSNVNVARQEAPDDASLRGLIAAGRKEVRRLGGRDVRFGSTVPDVLAGSPALRYDFRTDGKRVRQIGALHDGDLYLITLTTAADSFARTVPRLERMLETWRWE